MHQVIGIDFSLNVLITSLEVPTNVDIIVRLSMVCQQSAKALS